MTIFHQNSTAANGVFVNNGGASENSLGGQTFFADNATAANSNITNKGGTAIFRYGGQTIFRGTSTAASATISNEGPSGLYAYVGKTLFFDSASAGSAAITNLASTGGPTTTDFYGTSTAAGATIINTVRSVRDAGWHHHVPRLFHRGQWDVHQRLGPLRRKWRVRLQGLFLGRAGNLHQRPYGGVVTL